MGDHNIILQSQKPNIRLFLPFLIQNQSPKVKDVIKGLICYQLCLRSLIGPKYLKLLTIEPLLRRELVEQWWNTWSSGGVVVLGGGTRYLSVETSLFIHAKEQSPENRERQEWQKNCGD